MRLRVPINDGVANCAPEAPQGVLVLIPAALNRPSHTLYSICVAVQPTLQEWTVNRRYSQFLTLSTDIITVLLARKAVGCPACASFALALRQFPFPRKSWLRTNRIVRKRVKALQQFLQLIVSRLYNDLPKCHVCGEQVKKMVRPFLIRGAQPIGDSTLAKIQHSLSLQSYAIVKHKPRNLDQLEKAKKAPGSNNSDDSYSATVRTDSDPALENPDSPNQSVDFAATTVSEDAYGKQFDGDQRCTDTPVALEEALKQVVLADKRKKTLEEIVFRLSSMWSVYDLDETMAAAPQLEMRLSNAMEEESEDGMGDGGSGPNGVFVDEDDEILMLEDGNGASLALLQDDFVFDEGDDRETLEVDELELVELTI